MSKSHLQEASGAGTAKGGPLALIYNLFEKGVAVCVAVCVGIRVVMGVAVCVLALIRILLEEGLAVCVAMCVGMRVAVCVASVCCSVCGNTYHACCSVCSRSNPHFS